MWKVLELSDDHDWNELSASSSLEELDQIRQDNPHSVTLWVGTVPDDGAEAGALVEKVRALNNERVSHLVLGEINLISPSAACGGNCFCVVAHGKRECQTQYCEGNACWWISCGSNC